MRIAFLSPLPPSLTGIAHYASMLLPELRERAEVTAFPSLEGYDRAKFDVAVYQLGNNPHHEWIYREAMDHPGIAVLHDIVLHHLIVEMTLARGDADAYAAALGASHGAAGEAWARGRAIGLHDEIGNFLFPSSVELANRSRAVIVHNRWASDRLTSLGVTTPVHVVPHPAILSEPDPVLRARVRSELGYAADRRVIGLFGFLTSAKRAESVLEAFARCADPRLALLVVGEPAPNIDTRLLERPGVTMTGYVADDEFAGYYAAADRMVNLRYPSAGESSGTVLRAFAAGKPVAVSDYAQFAELPDHCVEKIPLGEGEVDALARFFERDIDAQAVAAAQHSWIRENATVAHTADAYLHAIEETAVAGGEAIGREIALFPRLEVVEVRAGSIRLRNSGDFALKARLYGSPGYRLIAKLFDEKREIADRWLELPADLGPGDVVDLPVPHVAGATLRLYHALESVPMLEPDAWYAATV